MTSQVEVQITLRLLWLMTWWLQAIRRVGQGFCSRTWHSSMFHETIWRRIVGNSLTLDSVIVLPMMYLNFRATRMRKRMQDQFPVALDVFVRGLRAGHPIAAALDLNVHTVRMVVRDVVAAGHAARMPGAVSSFPGPYLYRLTPVGAQAWSDFRSDARLRRRPAKAESLMPRL